MSDTNFRKMETDKNDEVSFETVLETLGPLGKFQMIQVIFCFLSMFFMAGVVMSFVFQGYEPPHVCNSVNETELLSRHGLLNDSTAEVVYDSCEIRIVSNQSGNTKEIMSMNCPNGRNFFDAKDTTFLSEWDLVCESRGMAEISQTCFTVGQLIGAVIGPAFADRNGRRPVFIVSSFLCTIVEWCIVLAPNIFAVYGLKLVSGVCYQSLGCVFFMYAVEFITPQHREAFGCLTCVTWVVPALMEGTFGYMFRNDSWRYLQGATGIMGLIALAYPFVMHESPRWLAAKGKIEETLRVLEKASKMNGKNFEEVKETFKSFVTQTFPSSNSQTLSLTASHDLSDDVIFKEIKSKEERKPSIFELLRHKSLRIRALIMWFLYVTNALTYYGMYMTSSNVAGDRFLNYTFLTLVEIPSSICLYFVMKKWNRRFVLMTFLGLTAVSLMASTLLTTFAENIEGSDVTSTSLFILGKFAITSSFNVVFIVAPEIFPTTLRSTATGFCSGLARVGLMVAPFMRPFYSITKWGPNSIFTTMCVIGIVLTVLLPESKDVNLPDSISDMNEQKKREGNQKHIIL